MSCLICEQEIIITEIFEIIELCFRERTGRNEIRTLDGRIARTSESIIRDDRAMDIELLIPR